MRDSWSHFNIFNENVKWLDEHGYYVQTPPPPTITMMPPSSSSLASSVSSSFSSTGRGTLLVGVASPFIIETLSISLRRKKRKEMN